jgi:hypothetical protein
MGARTIVSATANVNPAAIKIKRLVDAVIDAYKDAEARETPQTEEAEDAAREH